jgi:outer membrane protein insertion porin family
LRPKSESFIFIGLFLFLSLNSKAQEKPKVLDVKIVGNKNVSESAIIAKIKIRPGQNFSQQLIDEDVKRLYATGFFTDISVDVREEPEGVVVLFNVREAPYVASVTFQGNRAFKAEKLRQWIKTSSGQFLDKWQLKTDLEEIKRRYLEKGYAGVEVTHKLEIDPLSNRAEVKIIIQEGGKVKIRKIDVVGNKALK